MAWKRNLTYLFGLLWLLVVLPADVRADPITAGILAIGAFLTTTSTGVAILTAAIGVGVSLGAGAIMRALNPPKPINSPRQDITINKSRFGEPIPRIYKKFAAGGHVIWSGNYPTVNYTSEQIGSGKRKQTVNNTYYSMSFGVMVCENIDDTVLGVTRVWLDNHLVYNVNDYGGGEAALNGTDQMTVIHGAEAYPNNIYGSVTYNSQSYAGKARNFRVSLGNSAQTIDTVADWYRDEVGSGNTPAYRGYVTLWWNDMDLRDYYNRLPTVKVEVLTSHDTLDEIVAAECKLAGVAAADLNLTELATIPSPGCFNDVASPKAFFESLMFYRRFAIVNVDGDLKGLLIPRDPSTAPDGGGTVSHGVLGTRQAGIEEGGDQPPKFTFRTEQTGELPKHFELTFFDYGKNYEQGSMPYVYPIGDATSTAQFYVPIAIGATDASGVQTVDALAILSGAASTTYSERSSVHLTLPPSFAQYHPGDVLTIPAPNNQLVDCRFQKMQYIPGQMVEVDAVRQIRKSNVGASTEANPDNLPNPSTGSSGGVADTIIETTYVLSNVPPLFDEHEMFAGIYGAATPSTEQVAGNLAWKGATFARNACGSDETYQEYQVIGHTDTAATIGVALTALASATGTDTTNTVDIQFPYGIGSAGIETILTQAWSNSSTINLAILGKEVLQFKTVTDLATNPPSFRLSNFHRGMRDTEAFVGTHALVNEVQTLTFGGTITGGTFTLTFNGYTTAAISWSSTNATLVSNIDTALGALTSIGGVGNVDTAVGVMTAGIGTITVTFVGTLAATDVPLMTKNSTNLTGTAPTLAVSLTTEGYRDAFVLVTPQSVIRLPVNLDEHSVDGGATPIHNWKCYTDGQSDTDIAAPVTFIIWDGGATTLKSN